MTDTTITALFQEFSAYPSISKQVKQAFFSQTFLPLKQTLECISDDASLIQEAVNTIQEVLPSSLLMLRPDHINELWNMADGKNGNDIQRSLENGVRTSFQSISQRSYLMSECPSLFSVIKENPSLVKAAAQGIATTINGESLFQGQALTINQHLENIPTLKAEVISVLQQNLATRQKLRELSR